jgi:hypothetical protein
VSGNSALDYGGGIYNYEYTYSNVSLQGAVIELNIVGGYYSCSRNAISGVFTCTTPQQAETLTTCQANYYTCEYATGYGAGVYQEEYGDMSLNGFGRIDRNVAVNNLAVSSDGGGIFNDYGTVALTNMNVFSNQAYDGGGFYDASDIATTLQGDRFVANRATDDGGAVYFTFSGSGSLNVDSTQILGNTALSKTGGLYDASGTTLTETGSSFILANISPGTCRNVLNPCA